MYGDKSFQRMFVQKANNYSYGNLIYRTKYEKGNSKKEKRLKIKTEKQKLKIKSKYTTERKHSKAQKRYRSQDHTLKSVKHVRSNDHFKLAVGGGGASGQHSQQITDREMKKGEYRDFEQQKLDQKFDSKYLAGELNRKGETSRSDMNLKSRIHSGNHQGRIMSSTRASSGRLQSASQKTFKIRKNAYLGQEEIQESDLEYTNDQTNGSRIRPTTARVPQEEHSALKKNNRLFSARPGKRSNKNSRSMKSGLARPQSGNLYNPQPYLKTSDLYGEQNSSRRGSMQEYEIVMEEKYEEGTHPMDNSKENSRSEDASIKSFQRKNRDQNLGFYEGVGTVINSALQRSNYGSYSRLMRPLESKQNLDDFQRQGEFTSRISTKFFKKENSTNYLVKEQLRKHTSENSIKSRTRFGERTQTQDGENSEKELMKLTSVTQKILNKIKTYEKNTLRSMKKREQNRDKIERLKKAVIPKLSMYASIKDLKLDKSRKHGKLASIMNLNFIDKRKRMLALIQYFSLGNMTHQSSKTHMGKTVENFSTMITIMQELFALFVINKKMGMLTYIKEMILSMLSSGTKTLKDPNFSKKLKVEEYKKSLQVEVVQQERPANKKYNYKGFSNENYSKFGGINSKFDLESVFNSKLSVNTLKYNPIGKKLYIPLHGCKAYITFIKLLVMLSHLHHEYDFTCALIHLMINYSHEHKLFNYLPFCYEMLCEINNTQMKWKELLLSSWKLLMAGLFIKRKRVEFSGYAWVSKAYYELNDIEKAKLFWIKLTKGKIEPDGVVRQKYPFMWREMEKMDKRDAESLKKGSQRTYKCFYKVFGQKIREIRHFEERNEPNIVYFEDIPLKGKDQLGIMVEKKDELIGMEVQNKIAFKHLQKLTRDEFIQSKGGYVGYQGVKPNFEKSEVARLVEVNLKQKSTFDKGFVGKLRTFTKSKTENPYIRIMRDNLNVWNNKDIYSYVARSSSRGMGPFNISLEQDTFNSEFQFRMETVNRKFNEKLLDKIVTCFDNCHREVRREVESCQDLNDLLTIHTENSIEKNMKMGVKVMHKVRGGDYNMFGIGRK